MGSEIGGSGGGEVEGERSAARRAFCFLGDGGAFRLRDVMARGRAVDSVSEFESGSGSSSLCRLLGLSRVVATTCLDPFCSQGSVLVMATVRSVMCVMED